MTIDQTKFYTKWYVKEDDLIGGWCIGSDDIPPSQGGTSVADFASELAAIHIVALHNEWLVRNQRHANATGPNDETHVISVVKPIDQTREFEMPDDHSEYY